ncbi:hypothetical protein, partial [Legionella sainthelensi]
MLRFFKLIKKSKVNKTGSNLNRRNPITIQRRNNLEPNHSDINQREIIRTGAQFNRTNQQKNISDPLMAHALTERQQPREEPTIGNAILQLAREKLLSEQHGHWQNEAPDNLNKEARMIHSLSLFAPKRKELYSPCYVTNMKNIYNIYKELYETLESKRSRPCMASLAQNEQTSGGYKQDEHIELSLKEVRELLNIPNNKQITLLNLVVNAQKNTNSSILLHMIQNLMVHTLCE